MTWVFRLRTLVTGISAAAALSGAVAVRASDATRKDTELFEKQVRPLLAQRCFKCHSAESKPPKGAFRLDEPALLLKGGRRGPPIAAGRPDRSLLIRAVATPCQRLPCRRTASWMPSRSRS